MWFAGNRLGHLMILTIAFAVVAGGGFWNEARTPVAPGGADQLSDIGSGEMAPARTLASLSTSPNVLSGYISSSPTSVTPGHQVVDSYVTTAAETIQQISESTGRSIETLLWANGITNPTLALSAGSQVRIPPADGVVHQVHDGDSIEGIAARYGVEPRAITEFDANSIERDTDLAPNRQVMIPGGTPPTPEQVTAYVVQEGDTVGSIAAQFGLQASTILWANLLPDAESIIPGQELVILPDDGVMVFVAPDDSIEKLAGEWGVTVAAIQDYSANRLSTDKSITPGQYVIIPGGRPAGSLQTAAVAFVPFSQAEASTEVAIGGPILETAQNPQMAPTGTFIWPASGVLTQYFHAGHNGWDIANDAYTELWAADSGTVTFAGWNDFGLGYAVAIDHGNGFVTWYGHLAEAPPVQVGQWLNQGEYVGPMGSTGNSTGPHVHFVIVQNGVYQDPGAYLS